MEKLETSPLHKVANRLIVLVLVCFILIWARELLVPLAWALVISLASMNLLTFIQKKTNLPFGLIIIFYILVLIVVFGAVLLFFFTEFQSLLTDLPAMQARLSVILHDLSQQLRGIGVKIPDHVDSAYFANALISNNSLLFDLAGTVGSNLWDLLLTLFYLFFMLYYKDTLILFAERRFKDEATHEKFRTIVVNTLSISQQYISGTAILAGITTVICYLILLIFGIPSAFFFSLLFGFLSLIPVIGMPVGLVIISLFTALTLDSTITTVYVAIALLVLHFLQENMIRPWVMGSKMEVNAFAIFFFVILGGFFWGISGMILFIPLASIIKILLDHSPTSSHYTVFLTELPRKPKKKKSV